MTTPNTTDRTELNHFFTNGQLICRRTVYACEANPMTDLGEYERGKSESV